MYPLILMAVAVTAIALRAMLPIWITDLLNDRMSHMGDYQGRVEDVDLSLYRGAYRIHGLRIEKRDGLIAPPLLSAPTLELSLSWRHLLKGALVGDAEFHRPEINFVDDRVNQAHQSGRGVDWREQLEAMFPLRLDQVRVTDGTVSFINPSSEPRVDLRTESTNIRIRNLTNVEDAQGRRDATLVGHARILGSAPLEISARFDPWGALDDFSLHLRITEMDLTRLNTLARAYAALDFAAGRGDLILELEARDGRLHGYAKPLLDGLDIFEWEQDVEQQQDPPLRLLWEGLSDAVSQLFRNHPEDRFATRIPIEGSLHAPDTSRLDAVLGILRNAFIQAYEAHFEGTDRAPDS